MISVKSLSLEEYLLPGNASCPGCGTAIALRIALKVLGPRIILVIPAGCAVVIQGFFPKTSIKVPTLNVTFSSAASVAQGVAEALKVKGVEDVKVVCWTGDGATADIGLSTLSGAAQRNADILYFCCDNEAYMNTGIQASGLTPYGAWTTTTPGIKERPKKDMVSIMLAHKIPYVAAASISSPSDYIRKLRKAMKYRGFRFIHILAPCPPGWRFPTKKTIEVARKAVETGAWILYEVEKGKFSLTGPSKRLTDKARRRPIREYIEMQRRFSNVTERELLNLQRQIDTLWEKYSFIEESSRRGLNPFRL